MGELRRGEKICIYIYSEIQEVEIMPSLLAMRTSLLLQTMYHTEEMP